VHAGICAGGRQQWRSLPRFTWLRALSDHSRQLIGLRRSLARASKRIHGRVMPVMATLTLRHRERYRTNPLGLEPHARAEVVTGATHGYQFATCPTSRDHPTPRRGSRSLHTKTVPIWSGAPLSYATRTAMKSRSIVEQSRYVDVADREPDHSVMAPTAWPTSERPAPPTSGRRPTCRRRPDCDWSAGLWYGRAAAGPCSMSRGGGAIAGRGIV
jgi:hypothetical protein